MKLFCRSLVPVIRGHSYSTRAVTKSSDRGVKHVLEDAKMRKMPNGLTVVGLENCSPVTTLAIVYNVGTRHESVPNIGLTHCLRMSVNQSTAQSTAFGIAKNLQQIGSTLRCTTYREQIIYSVQCLRDHVFDGLTFLNYVAGFPVFKTWELDDSKARLNLDLDVYVQSPDARVMDAVHKAAFRDATLGHSLYMSPHSVGSHTPKALEEFVVKNFVAKNAAFIGIGVDQEQLERLTRMMEMPEGVAPPAPTKAKYHGGPEIRLETECGLVHAAVMAESVNLTSKDLPAVHVLQQALAAPSFVQYGSNSSSKLHTAAASVTALPFTVQCVTASYSDSGLFGIQAAANSYDIGKILRAAVKVMKETCTKGALTDAEVESAKSRVKSLLELSSENPMALVESFATQAFNSSESLKPHQLAAVVDKVTAADVNRVAKQLMSGKLCMGAVGNLAYTPHLDELAA